MRFNGDDGDLFGRNICGTVDGYRADDDDAPDTYMRVRLDGNSCYSVGGSSGSPVYRSREGRNYGAAVMFAGDFTACSESKKTAKVVAASTMPHIVARSSFVPFSTGP